MDWPTTQKYVADALALVKHKDVTLFSSIPSKLVRMYGVQLHDGGGRKNAAASNTTMYLPKWSRNRLVIAHELAHVVAGVEHRHSWKFAAVYIDIVKLTIGAAAAIELTQCFRKGRVQFSDPTLKKKRAMSPERRAQLVATLAIARAKRAVTA